MKCVVNKAHVPSFDYQVQLGRGEILQCKAKKTDSAGWIWCTNSCGESCWIPEQWVEIQGTRGVLQREYNSKELAVSEGDIIQVHFIESAWAWVTKDKKETGWIPEACLKKDRPI